MSSERAWRVAWSPDESAWRPLLEMSIQGERFHTVRLGEELLDLEYQDAQEYIFPGIIDAHVHFTEDPTSSHKVINEQVSYLNPEETIELAFSKALRNLKTGVKAGITTFRDMGSFGDISLALISRLEMERKKGTVLPRIFTSGGYLTRRHGHAFDKGLNTPDARTLLETIRRLFSEGASFIKIMNDPIVFTLDELREARTLTRGLGIPLVIHTYTDSGARLALAAEVDGIEHPGDYSDLTIQELAQSSTFVTTTFAAALDTVIDPVGCCANALFQDADLKTFKEWYDACCKFIPKLYNSGVQLLCGTDAGYPGTDFDSMSREISGLEMLGIPLSEAIKGATTHPAKALGYEGMLGEVRQGAWADYLIFKRNPLIGRKRLREPDQVFCGGKLASSTA